MAVVFRFFGVGSSSEVEVVLPEAAVLPKLEADLLGLEAVSPEAEAVFPEPEVVSPELDSDGATVFLGVAATSSSELEEPSSRA